MKKNNENNLTGEFINSPIKVWKAIYPLLIGIVSAFLVLVVAYLVIS